jgi:POT family proton-dependent oligopeptide transporter
MSDFRRVRDTVPWRLWMVAVIVFWERAAFWGLLAPWRKFDLLHLKCFLTRTNFVTTENYMEKPPASDGQQTLGALGLGQALATRIYCCFYIFYYVSPIFIAIIADSKLGHFTSLVTSVVLYCLGILALIITSIPTNIAKGWGVPGMVVAMFLIGLGGGGVKAILPAFLADQYTKKEPQLKKLKTGETVITDYDLTLQYIYNLYFWIGNVGSLSWFGTVYIEKRYGFAEAYGFTLGPMVIALLMLVLGKKWYLQVPHKDNLIVPQATKIVACAARHGFQMKRTDPDYQFEHRHKLVSWDGNMVAELTRGLRGCRVLLVFVTFWVCFDQMQNNLISQAGQMKTDSTPNDLLPALNQVGCIILSPLIQMVLYPLLHRRRIYIGPIMRITIGFGFMALAMLYAIVVQHFIYSTATCFENTGNCSAAIEQHNRPSVWIQAPIYFLISIGEIFSYVTGLEYAYDHSPKDMKVIVQAINLLVAGAGSAVALALSAVAHDPNLVIFYASLTGAMTVTTVGFWLVFRNYDKDQMHSEQQKPKERNMSEVESGYHAEKDRAVAAGGTDDHGEKLPPTIVVAHDTNVPSKL